MGYKLTIIKEDRTSYTLIFSNEEEFKTDVFKYLVAQKSFEFSKIGEMEKEVEALTFEPEKDYKVLWVKFTTKLRKDEIL